VGSRARRAGACGEGRIIHAPSGDVIAAPRDP
jgi:hypothetical protein